MPKSSKTPNQKKRKRQKSENSWIGKRDAEKNEAQEIIMKRRDQLNMELMELLEKETASENLREKQL